MSKEIGMYEKIGRIARDNRNNRWSFGELADELGLGSAWQAGQEVDRAWHYFESHGDWDTCAAISRVFWVKGQR